MTHAIIHVPDVPAPAGLCWAESTRLIRCTYPAGHTGPHQWEQPLTKEGLS